MYIHINIWWMEKHECVKSFCYLGDTLDEDGGADLVATARIRN